MKNIIRTCNLTVKFSKFTLNIEIYREFGEKLFKLLIYLLFCVNFKNITVEFYIPYVLNINIKFRLNWIFFIIRSINLFFIHNFRS